MQKITPFVWCNDQAEKASRADLSAGCIEEQCGWLKDKYHIPWKTIPSFLGDANPAKAQAVTGAMI